MLLKIAGGGLGFCNALLFARVLGARQYGLMTLVVASATLSGTVAALGLPFLMTREIAVSRRRGRFGKAISLIRNSLRLSTLTSAVCVASALIAYFLLRNRYSASVLHAIPMSLVAVGVCIVPLIAFNQLRAGILRGFDRIVAADVPEYLLRPGFMLTVLACAVAVGLKLDAATAVDLQCAAIVLALLLGTYLLRQSLRDLARDAKRKRAVPDGTPNASEPLWKVSPQFLVITLLAITDAQISIYIIAVFLGSKSVGIYQVALQPLTVISLGVAAAGMSIQPRLAASWATESKNTSQAIINKATGFSSAIALAVGVPMIVFAPFLARLYGPGFEAAGTLILILTIGQIVHGMTGPIGVVLMMTGRQKQLFYFDTVFLMIKVLSIVVGIRFLGLLGAAVGEAVYRIAMRLTGVVFTYWQTGLWTIKWRRHSEF